MNKINLNSFNLSSEYDRMVTSKKWPGIWSEIRSHGKNFLENNSWPQKNTPFWQHTSVQKFFNEKTSFEKIKLKIRTKPNPKIDIFSFFDLSKNPKASERLFSILASTRNQAAPVHIDVLDAINTMLTEDGFLIYVHENSNIQSSVNVELEVAASDSGLEKISQCKVYVIAEDSTQLTINLKLKSDSGIVLNFGSEIILNPNARLNLNQFVDNDFNGKINISSKLYLHENSELNLNNVYLNEGLARAFHQIFHLEENATSKIYSSSLSSRNSHLDQQVLLDHVKGAGKSLQQFRSMTSDKSKSVITGKVKIRSQSQKVDSEQLFKSLSLSEQSTNLAEPQLEIYADDVKATHGNACGDINEEELFYLQSRGINKSQAKQMLTYAFLEETVLQFKDIDFKEAVFQNLNKKLQSVLQENFK
jgi:Fe-S cluster assembly protein SufD